MKRLKELSYEDFCIINDVELTCIFAESGQDREVEFCFNDAVLEIHEHPETASRWYPQLVFFQEDQAKNYQQGHITQKLREKRQQLC